MRTDESIVSMTFDCHRNMESWVGTENVVFCSGYNVPTLFFKSTTEAFSMQGAWHSPNMLPTMVQGQACHIINTHPLPSSRGLPLTTIGDVLSSSVVCALGGRGNL